MTEAPGQIDAPSSLQLDTHIELECGIQMHAATKHDFLGFSYAKDGRYEQHTTVQSVSFPAFVKDSVDGNKHAAH
jgi:hypothetical protein